jgi:His-Xaa-Ser system radical SAM maturase HxsB
MNIWPLKFRQLSEDFVLFVDDAGGFFRANRDFLNRYGTDQLTPADEAFLLTNGHAYYDETDLPYISFAYRWAARQNLRQQINYVMLVPTLRCNLSCAYCQVSSATQNSFQYDWSEATLEQTLSFLDRLTTDTIKVEFQGGEPLLRLDLLERVRSFCRDRFSHAEFVVCTNLQRLDEPILAFLASPDTFISTSLDGDLATHTRQRTKDARLTKEFAANLRRVIDLFGASRVSALPTIDINNPPEIAALVSAYEQFGFHSIYLRPINFHGHARTTPPRPDVAQRWSDYHSAFLDYIIDMNAHSDLTREEFYFSLCLRRIFRPHIDNHVNLRNPNFVASDYVVIDYDGGIYPTDEARMLARIGYVDLSIGHVETGLDQDRIGQLNSNSANNFDPDCIHCVYQSICGTDIVDDVSRYGRVDLPRHATWHCMRHKALFDRAFQLLYSPDPAVQRSLCRWLGLSSWPSELTPVHND